MCRRARDRQQLFVQPLEPSRHRIAAGASSFPSAYFDDSRAPARARASLPRCAGLLQRHAENEVRVAVAGIAAHRFAQPVDRALRILVEPIRVAEIEEQIAVARIELGAWLK
jgi:hypothetical protein